MLDTFAKETLALLQAKGLYRTLVTRHKTGEVTFEEGDKAYISFSCNDYFGLSQHPLVKKAAQEAIHYYGVGAGASRLVTGNHPFYIILEKQLAALKKTEAACVFGSGYLTHIGVIPVLVGSNDLVVADKYIHASMLDGVKLSGAKLTRFRHNDTAHCVHLLKKYRKHYRHCLILTEETFSMDGDRAPLEELLDLALSYEAWCMVDGAHSLDQEVPGHTHPSHYIAMGTLSKVMGGYGGYISASAEVVEMVRNKARTLLFSTALPPAVVAANSRALALLGEPSYGHMLSRPLANARYFTQLLSLPPAQSAIVPLILKEEKKVMEAAAYLLEKGFLVAAIRPPTVPLHTSRLRFSFSAHHSKEQIEALAKAVSAIR